METNGPVWQFFARLTGAINKDYPFSHLVEELRLIPGMMRSKYAQEALGDNVILFLPRSDAQRFVDQISSVGAPEVESFLLQLEEQGCLVKGVRS